MKKIDYSKKRINPKYYSKIKIEGNSEREGPKVLTQEEFLNHEQGLVYIDNITNKLTFLIKD